MEQNKIDINELPSDLVEQCRKSFESLISVKQGRAKAQELYRKGNSRDEFYGILEKNMRPVYDSARRQGYEIWEYYKN